jgi:hypothetical protein
MRGTPLTTGTLERVHAPWHLHRSTPFPTPSTPFAELATRRKKSLANAGIARPYSRRDGNPTDSTESKELKAMQTTSIRSIRAPKASARSAESRYDVLFLVMELSDALRRGVRYYSVEGRHLDDLNRVLLALIEDGEVSYDDGHAEAAAAH